MAKYNLLDENQLKRFTQIEVEIDADYGIVWVYQNPRPRPCFNPILIEEVRSIQIMLETYDGHLPYRGGLVPIHYHVLDSRTPSIFSMGGDLDLFRDHIIRRDKEGLLKYAKSCIDTIHGFIVGCRLPITTISLVRGDALGGGFEVALSGQVVIAEQGIEMGFPEVLFNIFPGMGGYHLLSQRMPPKQVEKMMLDGCKYPADKLYEMGVIDNLVEKGEGENAVYSFVEQSERYRNGYLAMKNVREKVHPVSYEELMDVCSYWVDVAMQISERDLRLMDKLVKAQDKKASTGYQDYRHRISA